MLPVTRYLSSLLVLLSLWHGGFTLPLTTQEPVADTCVICAQALLGDIVDALDPHNKTLQENLFKGISCTQQSIDLNTKTDTPSACTPQGASCSGGSKSQFNQELCMQNIEEDLHHYYTFLSAHPDPDRFLRSTVLLSLQDLMTKCFSWTLPEDPNKSCSESPSSYDNRLSLCKKLRGFQIRSITINRALRYMKSGEHNK